MAFVRSLVRFLYEFVVGDDWRIAAGVVFVLAAGGTLVATGALREGILVPLVGAGIIAVVGASIAAGARR